MTAIKGEMKPRQGFQKGNQLYHLAVEAKEEKKQELFDWLGSGAKVIYADKLERLALGEELSKPEQEFMDRSERLMPYHKGRKTEVEVNVTVKQVQAFQFVDKAKVIDIVEEEEQF